MEQNVSNVENDSALVVPPTQSENVSSINTTNAEGSAHRSTTMSKQLKICLILLVFILPFVVVIAFIKSDLNHYGVRPFGSGGYVWENYTQYYTTYGFQNVLLNYCVLRNPWSTQPTNVTACENGCYNEYPDYLSGIVYVDRTSLCYCSFYRYQAQELGLDNQCANNSNASIFANSTIQLWVLHYIQDGRRFVETNGKWLQSSLALSQELMDEKETKKANSNVSMTDNVLSEQWLSRALSEHASIAAFNKISLQLMVLGSPLKLLESVQKAALDEWRHTQVALDYGIAYGRLEQNSVTIGAFPPHMLTISNNDSDIANVAYETFVDGCIQETLGCLMIAKQANNVANSRSAAVDSLLLQRVTAIGRDEVTHAQLAWDILKWMYLSFDLQTDVQQWMSTLRNRAKIASEVYAHNARLLFARDEVDAVVLKQHAMIDEKDVQFVLNYTIEHVFVPLANTFTQLSIQTSDHFILDAFDHILKGANPSYCVV